MMKLNNLILLLIVLICTNSITYSFQSPIVNAVYQVIPGSNRFNISGSNFGQENSAISVKIGGKTCTVVTASANSVVFEVPNDIEKGDLTLSVDNDVNNPPYPFNLPPYISDVSRPDITGGDVTIVGSYLRYTKIYQTTDKFSNDQLYDCAFTIANYPVAKIRCNVHAGTGPLEITVVSELVNNDMNYTFTTTYHPPTVTDLSPRIYQTGTNQTFTITGSNFDQNQAIILLNNVKCEALYIDESDILCNYFSDIDPTTIQNPLNISISINSVVGVNSDLLIFAKNCLNGCGNGTCNVEIGVCKCNKPYFGNNCNQIEPNPENSSSNDSNHDSSQDSVSTTSKLTTPFSIIILLVSIFTIYFNNM